ncbi:MAG: type VI secretion system Vgr family protein [Phycisphaerae bacterium]
MARTQAHRIISVGSPLGEDVVLLRKMRAVEELGRPFRFELELLSENHSIRLQDMLGGNITVRVERDDGQTRYFNGFVGRFAQVKARGRLSQYEATVVPWLWFLTKTSDCRIFQNQTAPQIIEKIFRDLGFTEFETALSGDYAQREYCVQYRETAFNFVSRLMEEEGIYYFFQHENGSHKLVMCDSMSAHSPVGGYEEIPYRPPHHELTVQHIRELTVEQRVVSGAYAHTDFDFERPKASLLTTSRLERPSKAPGLEIYDYPGLYKDTGKGDSRARVRREELQGHYEVVRGLSNARGLSTGYTFNLTEFPREDQCRQYLVTSTEVLIESDEFDPSGNPTGKGAIYDCSFAAIDSQQPFRPERVTPRPMIRGPQTAFVVGKSGEEIWPDKYGRVKVMFHWDRYSKADENSSCWVRVAQSWAGKKWGAMYIPRIGQEVIVEFLEGDPDRPIITGRVYNGDAMPPYDLPAKATVSTIKSDSSKGSKGFNEIRFEDKKGSEQLFMHAERNMDVRVKNDSYQTIGNDSHIVVKRDEKKKIEQNQHLHVMLSRMENVDVDQSLTVGSNQQEKVGVKHALEAGAEIHLKAGMKVVIEAGAQLSLKGPGGFINIDPVGVTIQGTLVNINSGGAPGVGSGSVPKPAEDAKEADTATAGDVTTVSGRGREVQPGQYGSTQVSGYTPGDKKG